LESAQRLVPDLILLDIKMPRMDGFEVLKALRQNTSTARIPTIIVTANATAPADVAHGLNLGANDYLYKPFAPQELLARAQSKIKARQLEDALERRTQELEALLRVGERLNQHLGVSELLGIILDLVLTLLPGEAAAIYRLDKSGSVLEQRVQSKDGDNMASGLEDTDSMTTLLLVRRADLWQQETTPVAGFSNGMAAPLRYGHDTLAVVVLASNSNAFDESHLRLFEGIASQAVLALRNAELYEIQANYALHLEDMVAERTAKLQSAQQLLIRSEKLAAIGHLAASVAHEINNPLQAIGPILESMAEDIQAGDAVDARGVALVMESFERIRRIVRQLLEFARKDRAGLQALDVRDILEIVVSLNRKLFQHKRLELELQADDLPPVYGSRDQLEQVFMNLTLNAEAAMSSGGVLRIRAWAEGEHVVIQFADTGTGISPDDIGKIFDPFFSTKPTGTGLGLSVSYGIIQSHQGTIEVESTVNVGTTFTIRLPLHQEVET
jgi:two-component system, NtrC family, sensor kinase